MAVSLKQLVYPKILTNAHWQKAKGKLGKTVKTGLGPELAKAEALFTRININMIDLERGGSLSSEEDLEARIKLARTEHAQRIVPLCEQWKLISVAAMTAQADLSKNLLGKAAAKEAGKISDAALRYAQSWRSVNIVDQVGRLSTEIMRAKAKAKEATDKCATDLAAALRAFMAAPSLTAWDGAVMGAVTKLDSHVKGNPVLAKRYGRKIAQFLTMNSGKLGLSAQSTTDEILGGTRDAMKTMVLATKELLK